MDSRVTRIVVAALAGAAVSGLAASCGGTASKSSAGSTLHVVALGDSDAAGNGDAPGMGWVTRYARLLHRRLGVTVDVANLARDGKTTADLLAELRGDAATRARVQAAQVVLLGVGGADLNHGDENFALGRCRAERCYAPVLRTFARNFTAIVGTIRALRGGQRTALRAMTMPNGLTGAEDVIPSYLRPIATRIGVYQARAMERAICDAMANYHGRCIRLLPAFNGPTGTANPYKAGLFNHRDCCYPNARGQQLMATLLLQTGLAPVR